MKKPLNEEFKRMQKLAGIILKENKLSNDDGMGIDLLDYDEKRYTPEDVRNTIKNNGNRVDFIVETQKFMQAMKEYIRDAGYKLPEEYWDSLQGGAYDGDSIAIEDIEDLKIFSNFTMNDAIKYVENDINAAIENDYQKEMGLPEDTTSIEDFKIR